MLNVLELRDLLIDDTLELATMLKVKQLNRVLTSMEKEKMIIHGPPKGNAKPTWTVLYSNKKSEHDEGKKVV